VRDGNTLRQYINGVQDGTANVTGVTANDSSNQLSIGRLGELTSNNYFGYVSNFRFVNGTAVYTGAFTPPTAPLTAVANTSLLTLQYPLGENNHRFVDESANRFLITRNGNATQGTFTPFSPTGWSNFFLTSDNYFGVSGNSAFSFNADFTVECFVFQTARSDNGVVTEISSYLDGVMIRLGTIGGIYDTVYVNGTNVASISTHVALNTWVHIAVVRSGTAVTVYVNGTSRGTATISGTVNTTSGAIRIAAPLHTTPGTQPFQGYISNFRIVKGTAVYTSGFTPPTAPLTAITNTSFLTCQSNRFVDNGTNTFAITVTGTPSVQAFSPFAPTAAYSAATVGGSGYFDGTGDYLSVPANAQFLPGVNTDFTFEVWVYLTAAPGAQGMQIVGTGEYGTNADWVLTITSSRLPDFYFAVLPGGFAITSNTAISVNSWNHIAVTRLGTGSNNLKLFLNGAVVAQASRNDTMDYTGNNLSIGADENGDEAVFTGYISGLRLINGTGNVSISVPTAPPTAITNTSLLLNFTNAGITDATGKNVFEGVADARVSLVQSKFGGSSMFFDGTGDYLIAPYSQISDFGTGDFTIEFWMNASAAGTYVAVVGTQSIGGSATAGMWRVSNRLNSANGLYFNYTTGSGFVDVTFSITNYNDGTWRHIAVSRASGSLRAFVDGTQVGGIFPTNQSFTSGQRLNVGWNAQDGQFYTGYIDDLRITRGFARYTANFTPPTETFRLR
jgi:hypothetical protein